MIKSTRTCEDQRVREGLLDLQVQKERERELVRVRKREGDEQKM